jgi:hypothetical protein
MFLGLADEHKSLCTSVFKLTNVFLVMNIGPEEYKKVEEQMPFSCSVRGFLTPIIRWRMERR